MKRMLGRVTGKAGKTKSELATFLALDLDARLHAVDNLGADAFSEMLDQGDSVSSELVSDKDVYKALKRRAMKLARQNLLAYDADDNSEKLDEVLEYLSEAREAWERAKGRAEGRAEGAQMDSVWNHFAKDPPLPRAHGIDGSLTYSQSRSRLIDHNGRGGGQELDGEEDEDDDDGDAFKEMEENDDDDDDSGSGRLSWKARRGSNVKGGQNRLPSSTSRQYATTELPIFFLHTRCDVWDMHEDPGATVALQRFRETKVGAAVGRPSYSLEGSTDVRSESQILEFSRTVVRDVGLYGLLHFLDDFPEENGNLPVETVRASSEIRVNFAGIQSDRRVDLEISAANESERRRMHDELEAIYMAYKKNKLKEDVFAKEYKEVEESRRIRLLNENVAMLECKTLGTLLGHEPHNVMAAAQVADPDPELAAGTKPKRGTNRGGQGKRKSQRDSTKQKSELSFGSTKEPIAQLCMYMVGTGVRYGALTDGARTFFVFRCETSRHIMATREFFTQRMPGRRENPGGWSLGQAWLVFLYQAIKNRPAVPRSIDLDWARDAITATVVDRIKAGELQITSTHAFVAKEHAYGDFGEPLLTFSNAPVQSRRGDLAHQTPIRTRASTRSRAQIRTRAAMVTIGPNLVRDGMMRVLGDKGAGYPDVDVNGILSFLKTTFAPRSSGDALRHEGCVYAKLQHLQGDAIPEVTAFGMDPLLQMRSLATKQCGLSLAQVAPERFGAYGGARALYYKAAAALMKIHDAGFTHGDVALRNIVVDNAGEHQTDPVVRFVDFERARETRSEGRRADELDALASIFGMRPEDDVRALAADNSLQTKPSGRGADVVFSSAT